MCGRSKEWHQEQGMDVREYNDSNDLWQFNTHTKTCLADSFGIIEFQGFGQETLTSHYIRLSPETNLETVWTLMTHHWKIPVPKLVISVTGGAQGFDLTPGLQAVFKKGLINAATSTGAWILTGGTATGVTKIIGDAVRNHCITSSSTTSEIVALGIATWGRIANRDALEGDVDRGLFPATYSLEDVLAKEKKSDVPLDHNHTHFILVDNGSDGKFGDEIDYKSAFERFVALKEVNCVDQSQRVKVPVVLLVVEGGVNTMITVYKSIQKDIPVLVFKGSGRAADFIAKGYNLTEDPKNEDKSQYPEDFDEEMMNLGEKKFADNVEKNLTEIIKQLRYTLDNRKLVNIVTLDEEETEDIDRAILYALIKANKTNANAQLSLALAWNRCDIARHEIFTNENKKYWRNIDLYHAMFTALVLDRVDFVQLFLENGVSLKQFLSIDTLWNLYGIVLQRSSDAMAHMLNNLIDSRQTWTDTKLLYKIGKLMVHLLRDENFNFYTDKRFRVSRKDPTFKSLSGNHIQTKQNNSPPLSQPDSKEPKKRKEYDFGNNAQRELFLWAILFNRRDLARMLWRVGQDQLGAALTACALLKRLSSVADDNEELELSQDLLDHSKMYENMAVCVLSECYKKDKKLAHQCLVRILELYGRTTLFTLAYTHELMEFMRHTCCQTKLNLIWKGRMALHTPFLKILLCVFFPFMVRTIRFTTHDEDDSPNEDVQNKVGATLLRDKSTQGKKIPSNFNDDDKPNEDVQNKVEAILLRDKSTQGEKIPSNFNDDDKPNEDVQNKVRQMSKPTFDLYFNQYNSSTIDVFPVKFFNCKENWIKNMSPLAICDKQMSHNDPSDAGDEYEQPNNLKKKKADRVQMCCDVLNAFYYFYTAPVSVFVVNTISYLIFLGLFTYFVLTDLYPDHLSVVEYIVWGWTITMLTEEIRQVISNDKRSLYDKVTGWFGSMWNRFDLAMYMIFSISVILRFTLTDTNFTYCRTCYSISVAIFYLRFMQVFFAEKNSGPKVIMITNMVIDLVLFLGIFLFFLLSFGIMYQANLFPNSPPSWYLLKSILYMPYWQMYGELFLEKLEGESLDTCTKNESIWRPAGGRDRCPENNALVPLLGAVYLILTHILLVNLLIAMFSYSFKIVQNRSELVWRFYRYSLVHEFYYRPKLCPPFIILSHIYRSILYVIRHTCSRENYRNVFKLKLTTKNNNRLTLFVRSAAEYYLSTSQKAQKKDFGAKVAYTSQKAQKEELDTKKADREKTYSVREQITSEQYCPIYTTLGSDIPLSHDTDKYIEKMSYNPLTQRSSNVEEEQLNRKFTHL